MAKIPTASETWVAAVQLLEDPRVTELHFHGPDRWTAKTGGSLHPIQRRFDSEDDLIRWCNYLLEQCNSADRIDGTTWRIEAAYQSSQTVARVHIVAPPVAPQITVTIAKRGRYVAPLEQMTDNGTINRDIEELLRVCIAGRLNFVVSGGTGSGKTTLLNSMLALIPEDERIGVLEEVPELVLQQREVIHMYNRSVRRAGRAMSPDQFLGAVAEWAEYEVRRGDVVGGRALDIPAFFAWFGQGSADRYAGGTRDAVTLQDLVAESVRMRFDRIVVGEVRGPEAADLLSAMNSGFSGSTCTLHSNSAMEVPARLQMLCASHPARFQPLYVNSLVAQAVDMIIHLRSPESGQHRVEQVVALSNAVVNESTITSEPLITWTGGKWERQGHMPRPLLEKLADRGITHIR